jgi:hypothetical protein
MFKLIAVFDFFEQAVGALGDGKLDAAESAALLEQVAKLANDVSVCLDDQVVGQVVRSGALVVEKFAAIVANKPAAGAETLEAFCHLGFAAARLWRARLEE